MSRVTPQLKGGLELINVNADSLAARAGIRKGDILVGLHDWETITLEKKPWVPAEDVKVPGPDERALIYRGGETLQWQVVA